MNPAVLLRLLAGKLRHAEVRERIVDVDGTVVERSHHYLTCKRCDLERRAFEIENYFKDYVLA